MPNVAWFIKILIRSESNIQELSFVAREAQHKFFAPSTMHENHRLLIQKASMNRNEL